MSLSVTDNSTGIYRNFFNDTPYCIWYQMKEGSANYQVRPFWPVDGSKQKFYDSTKTSMCFGKLTCHWARAEEKAQQVNLPLVLKGLITSFLNTWFALSYNWYQSHINCKPLWNGALVNCGFKYILRYIPNFIPDCHKVLTWCQSIWQ